MKRTVEISSGVGDHLDPADMEFGARRVKLTRPFARQVIADHWRRQSFVGDHAIVDRVADINDFVIPLHPPLTPE